VICYLRLDCLTGGAVCVCARYTAVIMSTKNLRKILVTSALPYANGPIHLGHLVETVQTDIWVRFQRLRGNECYFVCADDAHGTSVMLRARQQGVEPERLIEQLSSEHQQDFSAFDISFDYYGSTHSDENRHYSELIYNRNLEAGHVSRRTISQAYDPVENLFLADRFIRGSCPRCKTEDQYGDNCENCGATYTPADLIDPVSAISGATPIEKQSEHLFFKLSDFESMLSEWTASGTLQPEARNKILEMFEAGLADWDISRDDPYFGFSIPGETDKYFYVWVDAPIGYIASFHKLAEQRNLNFDNWWGADADTELYHFIGKDILYFHSLFWPALLHGAGFRKPSAIFVHGFLTVNGTKMSKSRGTFITAETYREHLDPEYLRYYYAFRLNSRIEDIDLSLDDFIQRVNSDLVGKVVNIASRSAGFIHAKFSGQLGTHIENQPLVDEFTSASDKIAQLYEDREYAQAMREITRLADRANQYINEREPWVLARDPEKLTELHAICTTSLNLYRILMIWLTPVTPRLASRSAEFLNSDLSADGAWNNISAHLLDHKIEKFKPLLARIEKSQIDKIMQDSEQAADSQTDTATAATGMLAEHPIADTIGIDDFTKIDLRIARITAAETVEGSDKLLRLTLDLDGATRNVFAGIKSAYEPQDLVGRLTVMVANLAPRKMRFGVSEGMVLATGPGGDELYILSPDDGAQPGRRVT